MAMLIVRLAAKLPPPDRPVPALIVVAWSAALRFVLAAAAVVAPVPPNLTGTVLKLIVEAFTTIGD